MFGLGNVVRPGILSTIQGGNLYATGGTVITENGYRHHVFSSTGSYELKFLNAPTGSTVQALIVGSGGSGGIVYGGGGGAGGVRLWENVQVGGRSSSLVVVGGGGAGGTFNLSSPTFGGYSGISSISTSNNVFPNPTDVYGWYVNTRGATDAYNCTVARDTSVSSPVGNSPLRMNVTGNDPQLYSAGEAKWEIIPARQGDTWTISGYVRSSVNSNCQLFIFGADASGSPWNDLDYGAGSFNTTTSWQRFSYTYTFIKAATRSFQIRLDGPDSGGSGHIVWFDGIQVERGSSATTFNASTYANTAVVSSAGGRGGYPTNIAPQVGGSGGGGYGGDGAGVNRPGAGVTGLGTGNPGGTGGAGDRWPAGGGGGYASAGGTASSNQGGSGGTGLAISSLGTGYSSWSIFSGMTHIASGGGGGGRVTPNFGYYPIGGTGGPGGGNGATGNGNAGSGVSYGSGGGGGGFSENFPGALTGGSSGSGAGGLVIVRYLSKY